MHQNYRHVMNTQIYLREAVSDLVLLLQAPKQVSISGSNLRVCHLTLDLNDICFDSSFNILDYVRL